MKFSEAGRIRQNRSETFVACDHMTAIEIRPYHRRRKVLEAAQRRACVFGETSGNQLRAQPRERWRREAPSRKASAYVRLQPLTRRPGEQSPYLCGEFTSATEQQWLLPRARSALSRFCSQSFLVACAPWCLFYVGCSALRSSSQ